MFKYLLVRKNDYQQLFVENDKAVSFWFSTRLKKWVYAKRNPFTEKGFLCSILLQTAKTALTELLPVGCRVAFAHRKGASRQTACL